MNSHICLDDEQKTITTVTSSSLINNLAIAYTKDPGAFYGMHQTLLKAVSGSYDFGPNVPGFFPDTEENFNKIKEEVISRLANL
jgi:hypothetical protein